ncbi:MAG TPA: protein-L-isoaspartate(D-aspartate) O-methyltransferase [Candidatus Cloacimonetes bacterium]|nr:protein-L-isoaspartate(D-aspartate) O-methyltransferase [Candidatus Cloacimonadota bacterium]
MSGLGCNADNKKTSDDIPPSSFFSERKNMVDNQIIGRGIKTEKVIDAFLKVERHLFVPEQYIPNAYEDRPLPIGKDQTISQPYVVAYMTDILDLIKTDKVLEIGTGSGYQAAILGELCDSVFTIEIIASLGKKAETILSHLGYANVQVKIGDGYQGWQEHAPYDAIIVTCAPSHIPEPLQDQLKEGGRIIIPVGEIYDQNLIFLRKIDNELKEENVFPVLFVPMVDEAGERY